MMGKAYAASIELVQKLAPTLAMESHTLVLRLATGFSTIG